MGKNSNVQNYSGIYPMTLSTESLHQQETTVKGNGAAGGKSEYTSNLTTFLLIIMLISSSVSAVLVFKIGKIK